MSEPSNTWQDALYDSILEGNDRSIQFVVDKTGDSGKSIFCESVRYKDLIYGIPPMRAMKDIMKCVMSMPPKKCYVIDMPRVMKKENLADFYSGLQSLKDGIAYDKRRPFKKQRFDRPQIVVFTNTEPNYEFVSAGRCVVYILDEHQHLSMASRT